MSMNKGRAVSDHEWLWPQNVTARFKPTDEFEKNVSATAATAVRDSAIQSPPAKKIKRSASSKRPPVTGSDILSFLRGGDDGFASYNGLDEAIDNRDTQE